MAELNALKCNICNFIVETTFVNKDDLSGWASVGLTVHFRGRHARDAKEFKERRALTVKIKKSLLETGRMHVCPGCVQKFEGGAMSLKMIAGATVKEAWTK